MKDKKYVDYLQIISIKGLNREFCYYCKKHRGLSIRRNARNFLLKSGFYNELKEWRRIGLPDNLYADLPRIAHIDSGYKK